MDIRKISICDIFTCTYTDDVGAYKGVIQWTGGHTCELFLHCNPDDPIERFLVQIGFEAIFKDRYYWTRIAILYACNRFVPYFHHIVGSDDDSMEDMLPNLLIPSAIEFGINGKLVIGFQSFLIGSRQSDLYVSGKVGTGFTSVKDGGYEIPFVQN